MLKQIEAGVLRTAFRESGPPDGWPVVLLHGFPYDAHAYDEVAPRLAAQGARVIVPWLRGYGPTRFLSLDTPRSGQQAALGADLLALLDALAIPQAVLAGYDWGGRAACVVAALWPDRARGLVTGNGYNIQDIAKAGRPVAPEVEHRMWYQYYLHGERGAAGLAERRAEFCRLLWRLWSPEWRFDDATYARSAASFENPDFVAVVVQSYRHRFGLAEGDPVLEEIERRLAAQPAITVPAISLDGEADGVSRPDPEVARHFAGPFEQRWLPHVGHNLPQEAPAAFAEAVLRVAGHRPAA
ncbi:alpha/beta fold hydrolase [Roseomonas haemaphysalidis]|uniref:Alpha/beta hydrolase n=1 Tax=Roseomonas haemaphysalidis TaxID=2768162 RepID=A0ABS3KPB8_9PROT|nr:alpha/beta hydrolase [Roseomonas haemaphysalidis]MBO1078857.1 alpha/beta hydrolase [Roseomonas haemaphysalidis]